MVVHPGDSGLTVEEVRRRPGMFIGDTHDGSGLIHLIWELVANSIDQQLAGRCTRIDVVLESDGSVIVGDDGPGIPVVDVAGRSFAERAFTQHHATATLDGHTPHEHLGMRGVGLFVVNALCSSVILDVHRDGAHFEQRYERGIATTRLERIGPSSRSGTRIRLTPDSLIFGDSWIDAGIIARRLRELASLLPNLRFSLRDAREQVFCEPSGITALLERHRQRAPVIGGTLHVDEQVGSIHVEAVLTWWPGHGFTAIKSYANIEPTSEGGTHQQGLIKGLVGGLRDASLVWKKRRKSEAAQAVQRGLAAVVQVKLRDPAFHAPTRDRLVTPEARRAVAKAVRPAFKAFLDQNAALLGHFGV